MELVCISQLEKPRESFGAIPENLGWEKPRGWFELSGMEQAEKGRAREWDCLYIQRRRSWKQFRASAELRRP